MFACCIHNLHTNWVISENNTLLYTILTLEAIAQISIIGLNWSCRIDFHIINTHSKWCARTTNFSVVASRRIINIFAIATIDTWLLYCEWTSSRRKQILRITKVLWRSAWICVLKWRSRNAILIRIFQIAIDGTTWLGTAKKSASNQVNLLASSHSPFISAESTTTNLSDRISVTTRITVLLVHYTPSPILECLTEIISPWRSTRQRTSKDLVSRQKRNYSTAPEPGISHANQPTLFVVGGNAIGGFLHSSTCWR